MSFNASSRVDLGASAETPESKISDSSRKNELTPLQQDSLPLSVLNGSSKAEGPLESADTYNLLLGGAATELRTNPLGVAADGALGYLGGRVSAYGLMAAPRATAALLVGAGLYGLYKLGSSLSGLGQDSSIISNSKNQTTADVKAAQERIQAFGAGSLHVIAGGWAGSSAARNASFAASNTLDAVSSAGRQAAQSGMPKPVIMEQPNVLKPRVWERNSGTSSNEAVSGLRPQVFETAAPKAERSSAQLTPRVIIVDSQGNSFTGSGLRPSVTEIASPKRVQQPLLTPMVIQM